MSDRQQLDLAESAIKKAYAEIAKENKEFTLINMVPSIMESVGCGTLEAKNIANKLFDIAKEVGHVDELNKPIGAI